MRIGGQLQSSIGIPEKFADLSVFIDWYLEAGLPILPPKDSELFITDDATSFCTFRSGCFMAEIYTVIAPAAVPYHQHPRLEVALLTYESKTTGTWGPIDDIVVTGMTHGGAMEEAREPIFMAFSRWPTDMVMHTVAAVWKGPTLGPKHDALITRFFPGAVTRPGYADVSLVTP